MLRRTTNRRHLLRKKIYKAPHSRNRNSEYFRENKKLVKAHQDKFKNIDAPNIKRKKRPKREVSGYKMSYRYKYYANIVDDEEEESE